MKLTPCLVSLPSQPVLFTSFARLVLEVEMLNAGLPPGAVIRCSVFTILKIETAQLQIHFMNPRSVSHWSRLSANQKMAFPILTKTEKRH